MYYIKNLITFTLYKCLLIYIYISYLSKSVYYKEHFVIDFNLCKFILFLAMSFIFEINLLKSKKEKFDDTVLYILYLISYIPTMILFFMKNLDLKFFLLVNLYWITIFFIKNIMNIYKIRKIKIKKQNKITKYIKILIIFTLYIVIIDIIRSNNIKIDLKYFNLYRVYELRNNIKLSTLQNIVLFCVGYTINPVLSTKVYFEKKYIKFLLIIFFQVLIFFIAGHKTQLLLPLAGIFMNMSLKKIKKIQNMNNIFSVVLLTAVFEKIVLQTTYLQEFLIRRIWFVPAILHEYYLKFFETNTKLYFSEDLFILRILVKILNISPPYSVASGFMIGKEFFHSDKMYANNGLLSYGYAECGILGIILYAVLFAFLLKKFEKRIEKNKAIFGILIILVIVSSISTSINFLIYYILIPFILIT